MNNIKYIKLKDILDIFIFILMILPSLIFKLILKIKKKKVWLICEDGYTARDNGYHLFKFIREKHPDDDTYYVISKRSKDLDKVSKYGNIIYFKSIKHWLYYMSCSKNISTQKAGNPAPPLFYVLHVWFRLYNNRVFLQHGITVSKAKWLYYDKTRFKSFICGAKDEYEYVKKNFGYQKDNVIYLGFSRFDNLFDTSSDKNQILIMPTWRNWLGRKTNKLIKDENFKDSLYFKKWNALLNNKDLIKFIESNDIKIIFCPHINMHKYISDFKCDSKNIEIVSREYDIQDLLKESKLLITDYSSIYIDFTYMSKPIIYYQFDFEEYHKRQYEEGYLKSSKNLFGKVLNDEEDVVNKIIGYVNMKYKVEKIYKNRSDNFFEFKDKNNSRRIYEYLKK